MIRPKTIAALVHELAGQYGDASALSAPDREPLSYANLSALAEDTRSWLAGRGFGPGHRIGLAISERPEMAAAFVSTTCCVTAAPLNPDLTLAENEALLARLGVDAVIVSASNAGAIRGAAKGLGVPVFELTPSLDRPAGHFQLARGAAGAAASPRTLAGKDLAFVMPTSGTTAAPKLVPISHTRAIKRAFTEAEAFQLGPGDCCLNFRPLHLHSGLNAGLLAPLSAGGCVVLPPGFDADTFPTLLREYRVTWFLGNPAYNAALLEHFAHHEHLDGRSHLRFIRSSSYRLPPEQMDALERVFGVPVLERYGGTEAGIIARNPLPPEERRPGTVGRAVDSEVCIVDDYGGRLSPGITGEIVVRGECVIDAYEGDPDANTDSFFDDWYRTGDLGCCDDDGFVRILGRRQDFINRGGQKISPYEVEDILLKHPCVTDAACFAVKHPTLGEEIWAAVVVDPQQPPEKTAVLAFAGRYLTDSKVPRQLIMTDALPRAASGKLKRAELTAMFAPNETTKEDNAATIRAFASPLQAALATVWEEVLNLDKLGSDEDFFMLGGDSLSAARLLGTVKDVFGVELPIGIVFDKGKTVTGMAAAIQGARAGVGEVARATGRADADSVQAVIMPRRMGASDCPLTFSQQRLWFLSQLETNAAVYNTEGAVRLLGKLDLGVLRRVLNAVVHRHESLRASFPVVNDEPVQRFAPSLDLPMPETDLADLSGDCQVREVQRIAVDEAAQPYDLLKGPLIRSRLLKLAPREHVLLLPKHHLIFDGQSSGILYHEIGQLYESFSKQSPVTLPALPIQYGDFACWQRQTMTGDRLERALDFWRRTLADAPPLLELPTDRSRAPVQSYRGSRYWFALPAELSSRFMAMARSEGVTLYIALLAAFEVLLFRYSGLRDFVLGSVVGGRTRMETESLIGFFVNTLALRADFSGAPSFRELLQRVRNASVAAFAHQDMPFDRLVEALRPERNTGYAPIVQVLFGITPKDHRVFELPDLTIERMNVDLGTARFDLSLMMSEERGVLEGAVEFSTDLFDDETVRRMFEHYRILLQAIVEDPRQRVSQVELLTEPERRQLLMEWNDTETARVTELCIHECFEAQVVSCPEAIAVVLPWPGSEQSETQHVTYKELNERANRLAHYLRSVGVGAEILVGICMERSVEMVVALLGILKAGGGYVPLDPTYPQERLAFMIQDSRLGILLTQRSLADRLPDLSTLEARNLDQHPTRTLLYLDDQWSAVEQHPSANVPRSGSTDNLTYLIYTSGSTGTPKGIAMRSLSLENLLGWQVACMPNGTSTLQFTSLNFDVSFQEMFSTWLTGGSLVLIRDERRAVTRELLVALEEEQVERLFLPFVALQQLAEAAAGGGPASLCEVITAGEQLHITRPIAQLFEQGGYSLYNHYGPSETHVVTSFELSGCVGEWPVLPPIGRPIANTQTYLVERELQAVPIGVTGELLIGGDGLARGYWNRPELSAERYMPNLFSEIPGQRLYRTGDLGRYLSHGNIEFLGRGDDQIKIRGFRVEPGEIEAVLRQHPAVREAIIVASKERGPHDAERRTQSGEKRLIGYYIVAEHNPPPRATELRAFLREKLPDYMIPSAFVLLESLPLTPNGKVDRKALPGPEGIRPELAEPCIAPRTPTEEFLTGIWHELLGLEQVGIHDNFFELGGHSLLAVQVLSRLRNAVGIELPVRALFEEPTVAGLALRIDAIDQGIPKVKALPSTASSDWEEIEL